MEKKYWETIDHKLIEYRKIKDDHLLNILKFIKRRAEEGVPVITEYGYVGDDEFETGDVEEIFGEEVLDRLDYKGLEEEAISRGLIVK